MKKLKIINSVLFILVVITIAGLWWLNNSNQETSGKPFVKSTVQASGNNRNTQQPMPSPRMSGPVPPDQEEPIEIEEDSVIDFQWPDEGFDDASNEDAQLAGLYDQLDRLDQLYQETLNEGYLQKIEQVNRKIEEIESREMY